MCTSSHKQAWQTALVVATATLSASVCNADLVIDKKQEFVGHQANDALVENHGVIRSSTADRFVFGPETLVKGSGYFENTLMLGTFAPGNSPGITTGKNQAYAGTLEIELGGTTSGFGSGRHDQVKDSGTITLDPITSVLSILSFEGYVPDKGDEFTILTWEDGLDGDFSNVLIDSTFSNSGIDFSLIITNQVGSGNLKLVAVPEASAMLIWSLLTLVVWFSLIRSTPKVAMFATSADSNN